MYVLGDMDVDDIPVRIALYGESGVTNKTKLSLSREKIYNYLYHQ